MTGRVTDSDLWFSGGMTEIEVGGATGRQPKNQLFRCKRMGGAGMVAVQLHAEALATTADSARPIADITWQVAAGTHKATVDIGVGSTLVLSAAEIVEVTVRMNDQWFWQNSLPVPWVATIPYRCFGSAAPASGTSTIPARYSNVTSLPREIGGQSSLIPVPAWARRLWIFVAAQNADDLAMLANTECLWDNRDSGAASIVDAQTWNREVPFIVPSHARRVQFDVPALGGGDVSVDLIWELEL